MMSATQMLTLLKRFVRQCAAIVAALIMTSTVFASGSDFIVGELSIATTTIVNARDYRVRLRTTSLSNVPIWSGSHANGWIGINLDNQSGEFGSKFTQVGILTGNQNSRWFVYAEPGATCLQGQAWLAPRGCIGNVGDRVALNSWHWVELVYYPGQPNWIARVYDASGVAQDVALIQSTSMVIYRAYTAMENAYTESTDPYYTGEYEFWHPQWMWPGFGFQEWPNSDGTHYSEIHATPGSICPTYYGATPRLNGDERVWFAGSGGQTCNWLLFPSQHLFLPLITK